MLLSPRKRICPSLIWIARSNTLRHVGGLKNGKSPSITSMSAIALNSKSNDIGAPAYFFGAALAEDAEPASPCMALKNSLDGSTTITSDLFWKLVRYASRLR